MQSTAVREAFKFAKDNFAKGKFAASRQRACRAWQSEKHSSCMAVRKAFKFAKCKLAKGKTAKGRLTKGKFAKGGCKRSVMVILTA